MKTPRALSHSLAGLLVFGVVACGQSSSGGGGGGSQGGGGGANASGGAASLPVNLGGTVDSGGAMGKGGTVGSGGANGGTQASGGATDRSTAASGGASSGGNGPAAGAYGTAATGGHNGTGGVLAGGGSTAPAGSTGNGGGTGGGGRDAGVAGASGGATGGSAAGGSTGGASGGASGGANGGSAAGGSGGGAGTVTCPASGAKPTDGTKTVMVGTTSRSYYLHVPAKYDSTKPAPLVVDFHGLGGTGSGEAGSNPYKPVIDPDGAISAYPDGAKGPSGTGWNMGPCCTTVDDVAFAKALVQDVEKVACIDPKRVYATGFSLGGGMTHVLACRAADVFAAASPAASDLLKENVDSCKPARPITMIIFRGTADTSVPYAGGSMTSSGMTITFLGAKATFQKWAEINQCTGTPSAEDSNGCSTYSSCASGVQVTLCTKQGGGHEAGNATVSWPLLKKYTLP